jgi:hypothetical protein
MLGRDNMSGFWCMWCLKATNEFNKHDDEVPLNQAEKWTINKLKAHRLQVAEGMPKTPIEVHGVVDFLAWEFNEVIHYVYPVLHRKIGLINHALDALYDIMDDNIEVMSDEEKVICNMTTLADAALEAAQKKMEEWKATSTADFSFCKITMEEITSNLQQQGISEEEKNQLHGEREEIIAMI